MAVSPVFLNRQRANTRKRYVFLAWERVATFGTFGLAAEIPSASGEL
jgi:hypothetical protein